MERADLFSRIKACMVCAVFLCFYSCSTSDYADSSVNVVVNKDAVVLSSASAHEARTAIVPRYVYLDKDKRSLLVLEDTLGPVYHLNIPVGKEQACNDIIDFAYINEYLVVLRYNKESHEVSSLRLQGPSVKTKSVKDLIPTGWVQALDTQLKTYTLRGVQIEMRNEEKDVPRLNVCIYPFARPFYLSNSSNYELCKRILNYANKHGLIFDVVLTSETFEIVSFRMSGAADQTIMKEWYERKSTTSPTECSTLTEDELQKVFNRIVANDCENYLRPDPYPCIPFTYPYDGCFARAHAMRRLVNQMGYECHKVFLYGDLKAKVNGDCIGWNYHVAIKLKVWTKDRKEKEIIIDPSLSLFEPMAQSEWEEKCFSRECYKDPGLSRVDSHTEELSGETFSPYTKGRDRQYIKDPTYEMTDFVCKNVRGPYEFWGPVYEEMAREEAINENL